MKRLAQTVFHVVLAVMALSFLVLGLTLGTLVALGRVSAEQARNSLRLWSGRHYAIADGTVYREYLAFAADREEFLLQARLEQGDPGLLAGARETLEGLRRQLEDSQATSRHELERARLDIERARAEKERLQRELEAQRRLFLDRVAKDAAVAVAAERRKFAALIPALDEAALAGDLALQDPAEAARYVREYMPADYAAEVLDAMPADVRRRVLPLIENPQAGVDPRLAARHMAQRLGIEGTYAMGPAEIYGQLARMNAPQALATYLHLPDDLRGDLEPLLRTGRP